ncbi:hypothetical protein ECDEC9B_3110 [Escherichia coli DEC9B]|nr:hypothetical protein ECDEC9B_3110 [Escherichia coli DEC9B]
MNILNETICIQNNFSNEKSLILLGMVITFEPFPGYIVAPERPMTK